MDPAVVNDHNPRKLSYDSGDWMIPHGTQRIRVDILSPHPYSLTELRPNTTRNDLFNDHTNFAGKTL